MTNLIIAEITGFEKVEREATEQEIKALEEHAAKIEAAKAEKETAAALKAEAKAGLLARLGITAEEAELLLS